MKQSDRSNDKTQSSSNGGAEGADREAHAIAQRIAIPADSDALTKSQEVWAVHGIGARYFDELVVASPYTYWNGA